MTRLLACPSCARHVRASERACPFCAASLPEAFAAAPARPPPTQRLGRAALFAFGATSIAVASACSSGDGSNQIPFYGAPSPDGGADAGDGGEADAPTAVPLYGASPLDAAPTTIDASAEEAGMGTAAYGAPFLPDAGSTSD